MVSTTEHATDAGPEFDSGNGTEPQRRRRRRARAAWIAAVAVASAGAGSGIWALVQNGGTAAVPEATGPAATTEVIRETIADTRSFSGTLGHGVARTITTAAQGVITGIADPGSAVERGSELYRVNEQPVTALYGAIPMYRDLQHGASGVDVEQLISNLTEVGYADCQATDEFTWCVEAAVRDWQADIGAVETGRVAQTDVVFLAEGGRVDTIHAGIASVVSPGTPVLDLTGSDQVVSLEVEVRDRDLLTAGTEVTVALPGGDEVAGTVTAGNVVPTDDGQGGTDETIASVEVTLAEEVDESLLGAPAEVVIEIGERPDVLTVPVNALVALAEGGHGLEVVHGDGSTAFVPVETGLFAAGRVEVTGDGIAEGTVVGVAGR